MNRQTICKIIYAVAVILFGAMTAMVAYNYAAMECSIAHQGASAPATVAFFTGAPFIIGIVLCLIIGRILREKK